MAYLGGALDATIAAAAGGDEALYRELRRAFLESAERQLDLLRRSRCDGNWRIAGLRLKERWDGWNHEPFTGKHNVVSVYGR